MFKSKKTKDENNMTYFFGGTAVGMAAGLLVGKVLSKTSIVRTKNFEPDTPVNKSTNNYPKNIQHKNENYEEHLIPTVSFKTAHNDLNNNINNIAVEKKYNKDVQKISYSNKNNMLHNINMEDNVGYNISTKILKDCKEEEKYNIHPLCETSNIKKELSDVTELESNSENNTEDKHYLEAINTDSTNNLNKESASKQIGICKSIELSETFNNLPDDFYDNSTGYKNLQNIKNSMINLNILPSYVINASSMATYNDTCLQFEDEENKILNFTSFEEFYDTDLISSTSQDDIENV